MSETTPTPATLMSPELLQTIAEAVGSALTKQPPAETGTGAVTPAATAVTATPAQTGETLGTMLAPVAAPILARVENRYKHPNFWVALGTIAGLLAQNPLGLQLHPAAQVAIAAVSAIYVAATAIVDSTAKGGGNG